MLILNVALGFDYPYVTTLLPNKTIEIHSVETQTIVQVLPLDSSVGPTARLVPSPGGYMVPSTERSSKLKKTSVRLLGEPDA